MTAQAMRPVGVDELRRAWLAVQAGDFRRPHPKQRAVAPASPAASVEWTPASDELVIPVVGAAGSCGATTVALALATAAKGRARVVECASASLSGLAAASTAELGADDHGWSTAPATTSSSPGPKASAQTRIQSLAPRQPALLS